ncbi:NAD(P)/FAD-dependent oxidoreductase [Pseudonocardia nigra]|uniref:NAD(P)/FAD-dependent oxidoreductase n=1 Tax=Pseudonocardia nigra TaxID=1921578 RepID=UPI001C5D2469|nr:FAD-dependent oxidoreductase [Pseudonocardia nigra]
MNGLGGVRANGSVSFWYAQMGGPPSRREPPRGDTDVDVCIVGGGFTGLWTAYYLAKDAPHLRIAVLEQEFCGFGASGRNGGWVTAALAGSRRRFAATHGRQGVLDLQRHMQLTVDEVVRVAAAEGIEADVVKSGSVTVARTPAQQHRLEARVREDAQWGDPEHVLLSAEETRERVDVHGVVGGSWTPHCARVQPARLVRGLADVVEGMGVALHEGTRALAQRPGRVVTDHGVVRAGYVLRATEGFTAALPGLRRHWLPMNSAMVVTDALPDEVWAAIGWERAETVGDTAHAYMYAQRTADGRIALGGRGVPYRFGSRTDDAGRTQEATVASLRRVLHEFFPAAADVPLAHAWAGVLAVPRDWCSTVGLDRATGMGWAGGYAGHGVATANLAGRTLRDLVLQRETELTRLPWVGRRVRAWEPEPLRWLGVRGMYAAYRAADRHEAGGRASTSPIARVADLVANRS